MNQPVLKHISLALMLATALGAQAQTDWAQSTDPLIISAVPANLQAQPQNPPAFTWARHPSAPASYTLQIMQGSTVLSTVTTNRNWYLPSKALPNGTYSWRVAPAGTTLWSASHSFVIDSTAFLFEVPENDVLRARILAKPRPRGIPKLPVYANWSAAMKADRGQALTWMTNEVVKQTTALASISETAWVLSTANVATAASNVQTGDIRNQINAGGRQLELATLLYKLTADKTYLNEALRRGKELAALDPKGPTSYANQDQGTRVIALSLAKAIDQLGAEVPADQRTKWLSVITARTRDIYNDLSGSNGRMDQYPYDSHGGTDLGFLALIATLSLGDIPEASTWFDFAFRSYVSQMSVWSGPEGGFANGTAYAEYTTDYALQIWPALLQATGVDMFSKPWSKGFLAFFAHFVPPGSTTHLFGDENEIAPTMRFMKAYASRFSNSLASWYVKATATANEDNLSLLQAPYPLPINTAVVTAAPPPNAAVYTSIGWSAMHSNINDLNRTSVFFKSSPYGSFNHSHGDQNAFVLVKGGVPLLTSTGWYDWYGSPMWTSWYRQTKAHNAVTFDGGIGQNVDGYRETLQRNGAIRAFSTTADIDFVEGDATPAYAGLLTQATRKLWYLRSMDAVVVYDKLASAAKHTYEWNFHARAPLTLDTVNNKASLTLGARSVCVTPVLTDSHVERRSGLPPKPGTVEDNAVFVKNAAATTGEFIVVLDVGCKKPVITLKTGATRTLTVGTQTVTLPN